VPEGHTVHRHAAAHRRLFAGREVAVSSPQGRFAAEARLLDGRRLVATEAWGKHEWLWFDDRDDDARRPGEVGIHVHLGLFGKWRSHPAGVAPPPRGAVRLRLAGDAGATDLSGPTACELVDRAGRDALVARLGPDPLRPSATTSPAAAAPSDCCSWTSPSSPGSATSTAPRRCS
jgi:formamidopyrimidine-DNA glycosylase